MQFAGRPNPYLAMFVIGLKNTLAYKADFLMTLVSRFVQAALLIFVWTAIYHFTKTSSILGITLPTMYIYFFLVYAFRSVINMGMSETMQQDILEGGVAAAYTRPIRYPLQAFMSSFSDDLLSMLIAMLPLLAIAYMLFGAPVSAITVFLITAELLIGYAIATLIGFLVGMLAVKITYIWGIMNASWSIIILLGGGILPLTLFPGIVLRMLMLTPFPIMLYVPAATFLGIMNGSEIASSIAVSLAWLALLFIVAAIAWSRVRKNITSAGG